MSTEQKTPQKDDTMTFYHVSTEVDSFQSFFREGAKSIGKGLGGQASGFYVWTSEQAADEHIQYLCDKGYGWAVKRLKNDEALVIGVTVSKESLVYPHWQQDMEQNQGLVELAVMYANLLNQKAHSLNIPVFPRPFGWFFDTITSMYTKKDDIGREYIIFEGVDSEGNKSCQVCPNTPPWDSDDSIKFQILTDWLNQNSPEFQKDYNDLMRDLALYRTNTALKYTGKAPLPISFAQYVKVHRRGQITKTTLFDRRTQSTPQVCPFLTMAFVKKGRE